MHLMHPLCNTGVQQLWAAGHPTGIPLDGAEGQLAAKGTAGKGDGTKHHQQKEQNHNKPR